jgi:DNA-binding SARP family transcriptional activator
MRIQVLGPVRAWLGDTAIDLGSTGQRALLGLLAVTAGRPMTRDELLGAVWGDRPPPSATNMIQSRVKHLRRLLEPGRRSYARSTILPAVGDGYALQAADVDVLRFRQLVVAAAGPRQQGDLPRAAALLSDALQLWHGRPLADIPFLASHPKVVSLIEQRRTVLGHYGDVMLAAGAVEDALPALEEAVADAPLDEAAWARLIRAYHAAGRRAQAFDAYHQTRRRLADELGVDPGPELVAVHGALLRESARPIPIVAASATVAEPIAPVSRPVPAQLPADTSTFIGRADYLRQLDDAMADAEAARPPAMMLASVWGPAGVGKTTLAVHWAHRVRHRFPDGQLYVNLRGHDPVEPAMSPAEAIHGFLDAFGVPPHHIPVGAQAQTGLYRSILAERRVLIVLDNALDADQVRPLLPGAAGCLVVVTSRDRLPGLVAAEGARPLALDALSSGEAREFVARRIGARRAAAEADAVEDLIDLCDRRPLDLAIVAARAATEATLSLAGLADGLRTARDLRAALGGDQGTQTQAVFSWSYRLLGNQAAQLFHRLGLHAGPDIGPGAAAGLAGVARARIAPLLGELARAHLIAESTPGRYAMHDLLRAYATELVRTLEPGAEQHAALGRALDYYQHTAEAAARLLNPHHDLPAAAPSRPDLTVEPLSGYEDAMAWFTAEHATLVAAIEQAAGTGFDGHAWRLAVSMQDYLNRRGHWHDWAATQLVALDAGRRLADLAVQARAHRGLARAYTRLGRYDEADTHFRRAAATFGSLGDAAGLAHTHLGTSYALVSAGDPDGALEHAQRALEGYRAVGDRQGEATALTVMGSYHAGQGGYLRALSYCQQALGLHRSVGDQPGEANTWDSLGFIHHHLGHYQEAAACYGRAVRLYDDLGDRYYAADTRAKLGENHLRMGDLAAARSVWRHALTVLDDLGQSSFVDADADEVRARLRLIDEMVDRPDRGD